VLTKYSGGTKDEKPAAQNRTFLKQISSKTVQNLAAVSAKKPAVESWAK
jgi:hypothetical protein